MIYIVVHDMGAYSDRAVWNEKVFKTKNEALAYIHEQGYTKYEKDNYLKPNDNSRDTEDCYQIEEWELK